PPPGRPKVALSSLGEVVALRDRRVVHERHRPAARRWGGNSSGRWSRFANGGFDCERSRPGGAGGGGAGDCRRLRRPAVAGPAGVLRVLPLSRLPLDGAGAVLEHPLGLLRLLLLRPWRLLWRRRLHLRRTRREHGMAVPRDLARRGRDGGA